MRRVFLLPIAWLSIGGCSSTAKPGDAGVDAATAPVVETSALAGAENLRQSKDVSAEIETSHDAMARRESARALARIADPDIVAERDGSGLTALLADVDPQTVAWAAYGLGYTCKGHEDAHVRMLAARAASLPPSPPPMSRAEVDPRVAIARAIGRCAAPLSEQVLVSLLPRRDWTDGVLLGLGDLATRRKQLGPDALTALLETTGDKTHDMAFYALGRVDPGEAFAPRMVEAARGALARAGDARILAVRTLGRSGKMAAHEAATELLRVVGDAKGFTAGERAEAARALGGLGSEGTSAIVSAIGQVTPDAKDAVAVTELAGASFHVLYTLLNDLGGEAPKKAEPALNVIAALKAPTQPKEGFARRLAMLRCSAALALARGAYDADVLQHCDNAGSEISEHVRLAALLRRPLVKDRLGIFRSLAKSEHLRIREEAIEAVGTHPELGDAAAPILADALASKHAGLVATAAEMLNAHPERAMILADSEKRAALDPRSPPPTSSPAQEVAQTVAKALGAALAGPWPEDRFETRIALIEAAASLRIPQAKESATKACTDPNPVVRERALKALRTLGAPTSACDGPHRLPELAAEVGPPERGGSSRRLVLTTDAGELTIVLEPELAPVTTARIAALAASGFYKGIVFHRVVPGFVAQLGDPDGDGYGGSGTSLRCETSPVPFGPLDVGMALAGRDTGSSQFFVTLARTPHLDGEYTRIGHAEGDWDSVAQGDVITDARMK